MTTNTAVINRSPALRITPPNSGVANTVGSNNLNLADGEIVGHAHAAMDLDCLVGNEHRGLGRVELGARGLDGVAQARRLRPVLVPGRAPGEQARRVEPHPHVGQLGLDHLEAADRRTEGLAFPGVGEGGVVGRARDADRLREGGVGAVLVENFHDVPFFPARVPPVTIAAMAAVVRTLRRAREFWRFTPIFRREVFKKHGMQFGHFGAR
mgnify:CR=1 FL=1